MRNEYLPRTAGLHRHLRHYHRLGGSTDGKFKKRGKEEMSIFQGLLVFLVVSVGIIVWAFCSAEEMDEHE